MSKAVLCQAPGVKACFVGTAFLAALIFSGFAHSVSYDIPDKSEVEIHAVIQGDQYLMENCAGTCLQRDGVRVADVGFRVTHFRSTDTLIFLGIGLDLASDDSLAEGDDAASGMDEFQFEPDDDELEEGILGFAYKATKFSIGKHISHSEFFGPSVNNFLTFSMNGLFDDRIDLYGSEPGRTIRAVSTVDFDSGFSTTGSLAVDIEDSSGSKVTVDYDLAVDSTVPQMEGVLVSFAAKSVSGSNPGFDVDSYGVKLNMFGSKGLEFTLGYSANDFGDYFEFGSSKTIGYRNKIGLGFSVFDAKSNQPDIPNRSRILDSDFYYINYAHAFSRFFHGFIEYDSIDFGDSTERVSLIGLRLSF